MNWLTVEQVAAKLRRNPQLVRRWIREGRLRASRVGPLWVVSADELRRFRKNEPERKERKR